MNKLTKLEQNKSEGKIVDLTRRKILKYSLIAACLLKTTPTLATTANSKHKKLPLRIAGYRFDRVAALIDGRVEVEGCDVNFDIAGIGDMNTDIFSGTQTWDMTEIGLHPFMLAYANEGFRDYSLIPVFPLCQFRHKSIFINTSSSISKPEDLKGRRVATAGFSSTSLTWIRGILKDEYGVRPEDIEWVVSSDDSSANLAGKVSRQESIIPEGLIVLKGAPGKDESDLLVSGDVDALFHAAEPRAFVEGDPRVARLFPDYRITEQAYFKKTGIFPIMHAVAIRNSLIDKNPWLPEAVFTAYAQAKTIMYENMNKSGWANISLPWISHEIEETRTLMGDNFWPYGIKDNRIALEALFRYSHEQGFAKKRLRIEDLFHPSTLNLMES